VLHVVSASKGEKLMSIDLGAECHVAGSVALMDDEAYLGHYGNEFVCVDLKTEKIRWAYPSPRHAFFSSPAIVADRVVFGGRDKKLHCARRSNGEALWTFPTKRKVDSSPVICGDRVVFGSGDGRLYMVRLEDGAEVWKYEIGQPLFSSPAVASGMIVIGSHDGRLYAFRAPSR
jgi:outer membrane protein assembly factor BamB